jgi:lipoprotein-releasing system permease protein
MKKSVNNEIALTHILSRRKQTLVASLGVTVGITAFVFLNSLILGFNRFFDNSIFKSMPHLRVFKDDKLSVPLTSASFSAGAPVIVNPSLINEPKNINNPGQVITSVRTHTQVLTAAEWVSVNLFYTIGRAQINGIGSGANIKDADGMFDIRSTIIAGDLMALPRVPNGILIGAGIAEKLNLRVDGNVTVISSLGVSRIMKIVGIFRTGNSLSDKSKCYMNLPAARQLLREGPGYVTEIYLKIKDPHHVEKYTQELAWLSGYNTEDWKVANETFVAAGKTRGVMMRSISAAILLVAAFGIYNILNMTIMQKLNDIAILKAQGFSGKDVIKIFVTEALIMGTFGTLIGLLIASVLVNLLGRVYIGGDIGYFPIGFEPVVFSVGAFIGLIVTTGAGFFPARNAAKVDPIEIFRK